ncbi:MAG: hypothetical protein WKF97_24505 [Chitinophagaceae bacterium]
MRCLHLFISLLLSTTVFGQSQRSPDSILNAKLNTVNIRIKELEKEIETERNINDKTFNSISTQISAASLTLTIMGIAFTVIAIIVGVYVTYVERKIIKIGEENKGLLNKNERIKKDVEDLNRLIQGDIQGLYEKLKRQETIDLIDRLNKVPKDVSNISTLLLSRELHTEDFDKLRKAYQKLNNVGSSYKDDYKLLFFQHFLTLTLKDEDLKKEILDYIPTAIRCSFENDILKSTHDFIVAVIDKGLNNFKNEINKYFVGLSSSEHKNYPAVYVTLFDSLKTRQNRFDFLNLIDSTNESRVAKIAFGKLLKEYLEVQPTQTESLAIQNIDELEAQLTQDEEDAKRKAEEERLKQEEAKKQREERLRQQKEGNA